MTKEQLLRKIASRKFWALVAGLATSIGVLVGAGEDTIQKVVGLIGAIGSIVVYVLAEAYVDAKAVESQYVVALSYGEENDEKEGEE